MASAPKKIKVHYDGEAAWGAKPRKRDANAEPYCGPYKKRKSDGSLSRALRLYYLRASASDDEVKKVLRPFGTITDYRREKDRTFAYVSFEKRSECVQAKKGLEHRYFDFLVRREHASGFYAHRAYSGLKMDYVDVDKAFPSETLENMWLNR